MGQPGGGTLPSLAGGGTLARGGYPGGGVPWLGGYPGQGVPCRGGTLARGEVPCRGGTQLGQHREYLLHGGRYASCVHAGGLSCLCLVSFTPDENRSLTDVSRPIFESECLIMSLQFLLIRRTLLLQPGQLESSCAALPNLHLYRFTISAFALV